MITTHNNNDRLQNLLQEELICFKEILYQTETYQTNLNKGTTKTLLELLDERELRIKLINRLENERRKLELNSDEYEPVIKSIKADIKDIALNLVRIDAELMDIVVMTKENIVKEFKISADNRRSMNMMQSEKSRFSTSEKSRFIDIRQE